MFRVILRGCVLAADVLVLLVDCFRTVLLTAVWRCESLERLGKHGRKDFLPRVFWWMVLSLVPDVCALDVCCDTSSVEISELAVIYATACEWTYLYEGTRPLSLRIDSPETRISAEL